MLRLALAFVFALVPSAWAQDDSFKESVLENQAEVMAFVELCDNLQFNSDLNETMLSVLGIEFDDDDQKAMKQKTDGIAGRLSKYDRKALCLAGEIMYGPEGLSSADTVLVR